MENIPFFTLSSNTIDGNDLENFIKGQLFLVRKNLKHLKQPVYLCGKVKRFNNEKYKFF